MRRNFTHLILLLSLTLIYKGSFSQPFRLLYDVNYGTQGGGPQEFIEYNGSTYFTIMDTRDQGIWKTDGTTAGTFRIKKLLVPRQFVIANGFLFFIAGESSNSMETLWRTDGTEAGTVKVKDLDMGIWEIGHNRRPIINVNGTLFFVANDGIHGGELWKSDGTEAGTVMVKEIMPGTDAPSFASQANINGTLYFNLVDIWNNYFAAVKGLWKSDGTEAGTIKITNAVVPETIIEINGKAIFYGNRGLTNEGLWRSDGTESGTYPITQIPMSYYSNWNGKLLMHNGVGMWLSDGSGNSAATTQIAGAGDGTFVQVVPSGAVAFIIIKSSNGVFSLWKTDGSPYGTPGGTVKIADLGAAVIPTILTVLANGTVLLANYSAETGTELWKSDGTAIGTVLVKDIRQGGVSSQSTNFFVHGNEAYFLSNDGMYGKEFWKSDGTSSGTVMVKDIYSPTPGSNAGNLTNFNNTLFFTALDNFPRTFGPIGEELRKSDGTTDGTVLIKDVGILSSFPQNLTSYNGQLYFTASEDPYGRELYVTNGNTGNATRVKDVNPQTGGAATSSSSPVWLTPSPGGLFFGASNGSTTNGNELWKTDGTAAGTVMVKDINSGTGNSDPSFLVNANGIIFFSADDGVNGKELWKSDGTDARTVMVKNIHAAGSSSPANMINVNGVVYFSADNGSDGRELWRSDGTDAGTYMIKDINGAGNSDPASMVLLNGIVYFSAADVNGGREIWKTDGTNGGTVLIKNINSTPGTGSDPGSLTVFNGLIYFSADNGSAGRELWRTDGTAAGTIMMPEINTAGSSNPDKLTRIGLKLFFAANDGSHGNEIWSCDGVTTNLVQDIEPGAGSSDPTEFLEINGKIFTSVAASSVGREVWVAPLVSNSPLPLTLLEFKGNVAGDDGKLNWKTENELNAASFKVERSLNGRNYSFIGEVDARNGNGINYYDYTDVNIKSLGASVIYYRLRQIDADNKFSYSRIVALSLDKQKSFAMLYPNPVRKDINLTITLAKKEKLNWQLTDNNGKVIKNGYYDLGAGSTAVVIEGNNLAAGNYFLQLKGVSLKQTIQFNKH